MEGGRSGRRLVGRYVAVIVGVSVVGLALYGVAAGLRDDLVVEDGPVENLTIAFYVVALVVSVVAIVRRRPISKKLILLAGLSFFGAMEELSYGDRLIDGLDFPEVSGEWTFDGLHDVNRLAEEALDDLGVPWTAVIVAVLALALVVGTIAWRRRDHPVVAAVSDTTTIVPYVLAGLAMAVLALLLDGRGAQRQILKYGEELLELNAAVSFAFAAAVGLTARTRSPRV